MLKITVTVKVEDGPYATPIDVSAARTVETLPDEYREPNEKGYDRAPSVLDDLAERVLIDARNGLDRMLKLDRERVQIKRDELAASA